MLLNLHQYLFTICCCLTLILTLIKNICFLCYNIAFYSYISDHKQIMLNQNDDQNPLLCENENDDEGKNDHAESVDAALLKSGTFGRYQFCLLISYFLVFRNAYLFQSLITYFVADDAPWECTNHNVSSFCNQAPFHEGDAMFIKRCSLDRNQWRYLYPKTYSFSTEFDLVCSKQYLKALSTSMTYVGCLIGALGCGQLADMYGRKPIIILSYFIEVIGSFCGVFVNSIWQYLALRVLIGICYGNLSVVTFVFFLEFIHPKARGWATNVMFFGLTISLLVVTWIAYYVRYWRKIVLITTAFPFLGFVCSWLLMESPYWLFSKRKYDEAEKVLLSIAKFNNTKIKVSLKRCGVNNTFDQARQVKQYTYYHLLNNVKVAMISLFQAWLWFVMGLVFFSVALESSKLGGDLYTNFILSSLADIPGYVVTIISSIYVGRKKVMFSNILGFCLLLTTIGIVPHHFETTRISLAVLSRVFATVAYNTLGLWTFEIYPTVIRSQGTSFCEIFTRIGSTAVPFLTSVLQDVSPKLPFFIMAGIGFVGVISSLFLPETIHKPTREEYDELFNGKAPVVVEAPINDGNEE